jgi:ComF family protein
MPGMSVSLPAYPQPAKIERVLDLVFPPLCVGCRRVGRWVCARCWQTVSWTLEWHCSQCDQVIAYGECPQCPSSPLFSTGSVALFEGVAREAVHDLKYRERHAIAPLLGRLLAHLIRPIDADLIAHVPLHASRRRERGYDQAQMLARRLAHEQTLSHANLLVRTRKTQQQALLPSSQRQANVAGAFKARRALDGEHVVLVDDVTTTGATMQAAARALRAAGAGRVTAVAFARAL